MPHAHTTATRHHHIQVGGRALSVVLLALVATLVGGLGPVESASADPTGLSSAHPHVADTAAVRSVPAYWLTATDGGVFSFGGLPYYGSMGGQHLNKPIVGMAANPNGTGYWEVASDGGIFSFGSVPFFGSTGNIALNKPIVGMAVTNDGGGYWLVASDGGIFAFGDAGFYGSMGSHPLNKPVVGMSSTPGGHGYWLVATDGGIFSFGDAGFHGSTGSISLNRPIISMARSGSGNGYWMVASDGGIFAFGDAPFFGSAASQYLSRPIVAMGASSGGGGYWLTDSAGLVFSYGGATYLGSAPPHLVQPIVALAVGLGTGAFASDPAYPSGAFGYDISRWQYPNYPQPPYQIGIVEVTGSSGGYVNPYLASEAAWAGASLNLYNYLTYNPQASGPGMAACAGNTSCAGGYNDSQFAFAAAQSAGVDTAVTWWLDVEGDPSWSGDTSLNAAYIQGALQGLQAEGVNNVGIYSQKSHWSLIAGSYSPSVPEWVANYGSNTPPFNPSQYCAGWAFASGPVWLVQFTDGANSNGYDNDYAC